MKHTLAILITGFFLSSCAHEAGVRDFDDADYEAAFGSSVRQNIKAQLANPDAPTAENLTADGARAAIAQQRYRADKVQSPERTNTLRSGSQGGGSSE